jgi:UPF0755 protein
MSKKNFMLSSIGIIVAITLGVLAYFLIPINTKRNLKLPSSDTNEIINYLKEKNYSVNFLDKLFLNNFTKPDKGWVYISKNKMPRYKFLLEIGALKNRYRKFTIIPGETTYFVIKNLTKKLEVDENELKFAYQKSALFKEGNFIADTYNIPKYYNAKDSMNFLLNSSYKIHKKFAKKYNLEINSTSYKNFVTIASILQKEAANKKEMPIIASVIYNRLQKKMRLQMDGALNYGKYSHTKVTKERIKTDKTTYNTYKHKGIPKEPVCNVSIDALKAAFNPAKTDYLYFMKKDATSHNFSVKYREHIKNIKKRKEELKSK